MKVKVEKQDLLFSDRYILMLIIPMLIETFLNVAVGMADTIMVSSAGEAAISGVGAVDTLIYLFVLIFTAFASGGSVVFSQYMGAGNKDKTVSSGRQLLQIAFLAGLACMVILLIGRNLFLNMLLGDIDESVFDAAFSYIIPVTLSLPFLAVMNGSLAISRAMGKSRLSMLTALLMNVINVIGNSIFIYVFGFGSFGAGLATLISRIIASITILCILSSDKVPVRITGIFHFHLDGHIVRNILHIAIPTALESSCFHFGKILIMGMVSSLGLTAMAANSAMNSVGAFVCLPGDSVALAIIPIIGHCCGAGRFDQAEYYAKRMMKFDYLIIALQNIPLIFSIDFLVSLYHLSPEAAELARIMFFAHMVHVILMVPVAFFIPQVFNASGDVMYTMIVSISSMWIFRVSMAYVLGIVLGWGILGVQAAMFLDWYFRAFAFTTHFIRGKWKGKTIIDKKKAEVTA